MNLSLISAWNDSGGGFLNRLFDSHPELVVWPYELQLGSNCHYDDFTDWFKTKYRWLKHIPLSTPEQIFDSILDDEFKGVLQDKDGTKHANFSLDADILKFKSEFLSLVAKNEKVTRRLIIEAYLSSAMQFFPKLAMASGKSESHVLAHCPVIVMDSTEIWKDFPELKFLHVIRHPFGNYFDFNKRHPEVTASDYIKKWSVVNYHAFNMASLYPDKVKLVGLMDLLSMDREFFQGICEWLDIGYSESLLEPTWFGTGLDTSNMGPFGGVVSPELESEKNKRQSLDEDIINSLMQGAGCLPDLLIENNVNI